MTAPRGHTTDGRRRTCGCGGVRRVRPYSGGGEAVVQAPEDAVTDPEVRALPRGVGSAEQWSSDADVLVDPDRRLR